MDKKNTSCTVKNALNIIQGKWTLQIIYSLLVNDTLRFGQLKKLLPNINNTALATALKKLEDHHIVKRVQYNELPLRVEYSLTPRGKKLEKVFSELSFWWDDSMD